MFSKKATIVQVMQTLTVVGAGLRFVVVGVALLLDLFTFWDQACMEVDFEAGFGRSNWYVCVRLWASWSGVESGLLGPWTREDHQRTALEYT